MNKEYYKDSVYIITQKIDDFKLKLIMMALVNYFIEFEFHYTSDKYLTLTLKRKGIQIRYVKHLLQIYEIDYDESNSDDITVESENSLKALKEFKNRMVF